MFYVQPLMQQEHDPSIPFVTFGRQAWIDAIDGQRVQLHLDRTGRERRAEAMVSA